MTLIWEIIQFLIYSTLIVLVSKKILIKVLRRLGELLKIKPKTIGNIAGIATSIPELLTVSFSAFTGLIATSTYNILSSNVINLIQYEISVILNKNQKKQKSKEIQVDLILVLITIILPIIMIFLNIENNIVIVPFFIILLILFYRISNNAHRLYKKNNKNEKNEIQQEKEEISEVDKEVIKHIENDKMIKNISIENYTKKNIGQVVWQAILLVLVGVALYFIGNALSNVLDTLCRRFNIPEIVIGILLGIITSIPELITFFESQRYHQKEDGIKEATGNLFSSNVMNLFIIQSIGIVIYYIYG